MLVNYIRNKRDEKIGCLVAIKILDSGEDEETYRVGIGWSKCHKLDKFDKSKAKFIAERRAVKCLVDGKMTWLNNKIVTNAPTCILQHVLPFLERVTKYFKDASI